jgi:PIN domain nuclease of toxin-antitoxin system
VILLDAFALLAYLRDEPAAEQVQRMLWDGDTAMTSVQVAEVLDRLVRVDGHDPDDAEVTVSALGIEMLSMSSADGAAAGLFRAAHYSRSGRTLSLADSVAASTALSTGRRLATADPVLIQCVVAAGGQCVELPPSG